MPSTVQEFDRPSEATAVAKQYLRRERPLSALVAAVVVSIFLGTFLATSIVPALVVGAVLVFVTRAPIVQPRGSVRLRTDANPERVVESFTGATPPLLAFQWGIADRITAEDGTITYHVSYLFGLRSVRMAVETRTESTSNGTHRIELSVTANGRPWSTYDVTVSREDDQTFVAYDYGGDRRFGVRRIPQRLVAARYREEALAVQGYSVVNRDDQLGIIG
ncbi:MAG: hypothetical protein ABEI27_07510 [Halobellus sp.]|uniref:hypothetical protein n=1 Tax=Halobellus sp. TaxID=1979212 RepID=UPI0035D51498